MARGSRSQWCPRQVYLTDSLLAGAVLETVGDVISGLAWWRAHRGPSWIKLFGRNTLPYRRRSVPISTKPRNALFGNRSTRTQPKQQNRWDNHTQRRADVISQHSQTGPHPSFTYVALKGRLNLRKIAPQEGKNRGALQDQEAAH